MMKKLIGALALAGAAFSMPAMATPVLMTDAEMDQVVGAGHVGGVCCGCECPPGLGGLRRDNGWGNGNDGTNPGSDKGRTRLSKNQTGGPHSGINANPSNSPRAETYR